MTARPRYVFILFEIDGFGYEDLPSRHGFTSADDAIACAKRHLAYSGVKEVEVYDRERRRAIFNRIN